MERLHPTPEPEPALLVGHVFAVLTAEGTYDEIKIKRYCPQPRLFHCERRHIDDGGCTRVTGEDVDLDTVRRWHAATVRARNHLTDLLLHGERRTYTNDDMEREQRANETDERNREEVQRQIEQARSRMNPNIRRYTA